MTTPRPPLLEPPVAHLVGELTDISHTYLPLVREHLDFRAEGVFIPSGRPIAFILNCVPDGLLLRPVPRREVADLMPKIYLSDGAQLDLLAWQQGWSPSHDELPEPPFHKVTGSGPKWVPRSMVS